MSGVEEGRIQGELLWAIEERESKTSGPRKPKRARYVSQACTTCKRRKTRCDGVLPCGRCTTLKAACSYEEGCRAGSSEQATELQSVNAKLQCVNAQLQRVQGQLDDALRKLVSTGSNENDSPGSRATESFDRTDESGCDPVSCRGPTSSGFAFDIAEHKLQEVRASLGQRRPSVPLLSLTVSPGTCGEFHYLSKLVKKDPLWQIDKYEGQRLIRLYAGGPGSVYPVLDTDQLCTQFDSLHDLMAESRYGHLAEKFVPVAVAMFSHTVSVLKLVIATGLAIDNCGPHPMAQSLFDSIGQLCRTSIWDVPDSETIILHSLVAAVYFHLDDEVRAGRAISFATRLCLELGLHQLESFSRHFKTSSARAFGVKLFWAVYLMDKRSSLGLGVPSTLHDSDISDSLPQPDPEDQYLYIMVKYARLSGKTYKSIMEISNETASAAAEEINYLDYQLLQWHKQIPSPLQCQPEHFRTIQHYPEADAKVHFLRFVLEARKDQLRNLLHRPILYSSSTISNNTELAHRAVNIGKESIRFLWKVHQNTTIISTHAIFAKHFLISAFATVVLALANDSTNFARQTQEEFYLAIDMLKDLSKKSPTMMQIWDDFRHFEAIGPRLGVPRQSNASFHQDPKANDDTGGWIGLDSAFPFGLEETGHLGLNSSPATAPFQLRNELSTLFDSGTGVSEYFDFSFLDSS